MAFASLHRFWPKSSTVKAFNSLIIVLSIFLGSPSISFADCQVKLQWDGNLENSVTGYRLFQREEGNSYDYTRHAWQGSENQCTITGLKENTTYLFVVRAYVQDGNESGNSNEVRFRYDTNPPEQPALQNPENQAQDVELEPDLIASPFYDTDTGDYHFASHWQVFRSGDDLCVFDLDSDAFLEIMTLPPCILSESTEYYWTVQYRNQNGTSSPPVPFSVFTTETWAADANKNGIADHQEIDGFSDLDQNQVADAEQPEMKCVNTAAGSMQAGVSIGGGSSATSIEQIQSLLHTTLNPPNDTAVILPAGLIGFKIVVSEIGVETTVEIFFSEPIPKPNEWLMYSPLRGYENYSENSSFSSDRRTIVCTLQDGGTGDMDGIANGYISALGGFGQIKDSAAVINGSGSSSGYSGNACFIGSLF
jgi:hypothetical protein